MYDELKIENQLCFPLYAASKEIVKSYKPFLEPLNLTYTQYITMMVFFEHRSMNIKTLGEFLYLDSGTLTPVVKRLEALGYLKRMRSLDDERNLIVEITEAGDKLRDALIHIPFAMAENSKITKDEAQELYRILYKILK